MNPLSFHDRAMPAAAAVTAAHKQGKYWEYYNKLWENNKDLQDADLERYAQEVGLNMEQWKKDKDDPALIAAIDKQANMAQALGASGTPAFFVNGEFVSGAKETKEFKALVDGHLAKADKLVARGVPVEKVHGLLTKKLFEGKYTEYVMLGKAAPKPKAEGGGEKGTLAKKAVEIPVSDSPRIGTGDKIVIVEFSDFQCPYCSQVGGPLEEVVAHYGADASMVFKHFPLDFHKKAPLASEASMAAHAQGKFWEFSRLAFANQQKLDRADLEAYAQQLGLDMAKFKEALDSGAYKARLNQDMELGKKIGVSGTPSIFINGRKWEGGKESDKIIEAIDKDILKK